MGSEVTVPELRPLVEELTRSQESLSRVNVQLLDRVAGLERTVDAYDRRLANITSQAKRLIELLAELGETNSAVQLSVKSALAPSPHGGEASLQSAMMKLFEEK